MEIRVVIPSLVSHNSIVKKKKKSKWPTQKKTEIFNNANFQKKNVKISEIGSLVGKINQCKD